MKYIFIFLIIGCAATSTTTVPPTPEPVVYDTIHKTINIVDTILHIMYMQDTVVVNQGAVNVVAFGAKADGQTDDIVADSTACAYCIAHPYFCSTVVFPIGHTRITRPLLLSNNGAYFTIHLKGMLPAKDASDQYLSEIICDYKKGYGIGIQSGRGIIIENIAIMGKYSFPYTVTNFNIGTLKFSDWIDSTISDSRYAPYAGISIDPLAGSGTSGVEIRGCSVKQFMVGIALSPNGVSQNDEMINIDDDDIEANRVAIAVCQDQSKTIKIEGLKVWASTYTVLDGLSYGAGTGGGSVFCDNWNIAGNVNQLFYLVTDRFPLSASRIYSESLFRIGTVRNGAATNMNDCEIDFLMGAGIPAPDFLLFGNVNFHGGCLRYYDNNGYHRMNFVGTTKGIPSKFSDMTLGTPPITCGLYGASSNFYPTPIFENVHGYSSGQQIQIPYDTLIPIPFIVAVIVNKSSWTATATGSGLGAVVKIGDYLLNGSNWSYYDTGLNNWPCPTIQVGRVTAITGDQVTLTDVGLTAYSGGQNLYINRLK